MDAEVLTQQAVLEDVVEMLIEVLGDEFLLELEVDEQTRFNEDLAIESIEFVALAEKLKLRYGSRVDFVAFLADKDIDEIMALTVGQVTSYIHDGLAAGG
jgi:acyl carrier protein